MFLFLLKYKVPFFDDDQKYTIACQNSGKCDIKYILTWISKNTVFNLFDVNLQKNEILIVLNIEFNNTKILPFCENIVFFRLKFTEIKLLSD